MDRDSVDRAAITCCEEVFQILIRVRTIALPVLRAGGRLRARRAPRHSQRVHVPRHGHSGWLGWTTNSSGAAAEFAKVAKNTKAGFASVDGFITDTPNYTPLREPFLTATEMVGGQPVEAAKFYQYNPDLDEADFAADMYGRLTGAGFPSTIGMLIDTSRSGWGARRGPPPRARAWISKPS
jgi:cellulase/cellobiase CelA1